jgi:5-methylcytosine-specific restriction enzyme subunit McrC
MELPSQPPTWVLKERVPAVGWLAPADVAFLLTEHRAHVRLAPTRRPGRYRLTPTGHVGTIVGPSCRLVIRPKVPVGNLFYLLDPAGPVPAAEDRTAAEAGTEALDFLAGRLARLLDERAAAGLHRAYREQAESGPFLQGRLDLAAHLRAPGGRKDRLHCRYEDFTADVPCNQVPRAVAERVLRSPLLGGGARAALRQALRAYAGVCPAELTEESFLAAGPDRLTEAYRPLLELCRLLADGLAPGEAAGPTPCPAFLINMERVFEQYVTRGVERAFAPGGRYAISVQPRFVANRSAPGRPDLHLRPDLTIDRAGRPVAVLDAKWKRGVGALPVTEDWHQVLAYAAALGVRRALLIYPGRRDRAWRFPLARTPVVVEVRTLRVLGTRQACERSLARLGRAVLPGRGPRERAP